MQGNPLFQTLKPNTRGRDFVVGDIHGCFRKLEQTLKAIGFDKAVDRLITMGDLVDRGRQNQRVLYYLEQPWFYSTLGNHELSLISLARLDEISRDRAIYARSWGQRWFLKMSVKERRMYADVFETLPIAIELERDGLPDVFIHAECPTSTWGMFKATMNGERGSSAFAYCFDEAVYSRKRYRTQDTSIIPDVNAIYVGHTIVPEMCRLGNTIYTDLGACFNRREFQVLQIT